MLRSCVYTAWNTLCVTQLVLDKSHVSNSTATYDINVSKSYDEDKYYKADDDFFHELSKTWNLTNDNVIFEVILRFRV